MLFFIRAKFLRAVSSIWNSSVPMDIGTLWVVVGQMHTCPNGLFLFNAGLFYKKMGWFENKPHLLISMLW